MNHISFIDSYNEYGEGKEDSDIEESSWYEFGFPNIPDKECSFDSETGRIDSWVFHDPDPLTLIKSDITFYKKELNDTELTSELLKKIIACNENPESVQSIPIELIPSVIAGADFLNAPETIFPPLVVRLQNYSGNNERIHHCMLTYGGNSIASWLEEFKEKNNITEDQEMNISKLVSNKTLTLGSRQFDTVYGLNRLFNARINAQQKDIEAIYLQNNNLTALDVENLLQQFPKLKVINAYNNKIKSINLPSHLPKGFYLGFDNNQIIDIPNFKAGERNILIFSNNPLSDISKNNLHNACIPNFFEKRKHYPFLARQLYLSVGAGALLGGCSGLGFGMYCAIDAKSKNQNFSRNSEKYPMLEFGIKLAFGSLAYVLEKTKQLKGVTMTAEQLSDIRWAEYLGLGCMVLGALIFPMYRYFKIDDKRYRYKPAKLTL